MAPAEHLKAPEHLAECTVKTPPALVDFCWRIVDRLRPERGRSVVDLGAGDGRFAKPTSADQYTGIEVNLPAPAVDLGKTVRLVRGCASKAAGAFDIAIGNPPYLRHHAIDPVWREAQRLDIEQRHAVRMNRLANLYLYFVIFSLRLIKADGIVALLVPFDWYSRPSARPVLDYVRTLNAAVDVYRISNERHHFESVYTTVSLLVIDRRRPYTSIQVHNADVAEGAHTERASNSSYVTNKVLPYKRLNRSGLHAFRGISPGGQKTFTLTEAERLAAKIPRSAVMACITTLRNLPRDLKRLDQAVFQKRFVDAGERCWLLKTDGSIHPKVRAWLDARREAALETYTCKSRSPWYQYKTPRVPEVLYSSAFRSSPKVLLNSAGVLNLGCVHGVQVPKEISPTSVATFLKTTRLYTRVIPLAKGLKKIEIGQMNSLLDRFAGTIKT